MYGRNGADQLCWAMLALELALYLLALVVRVPAARTALRLASTALTFGALYRMLSRNRAKRSAENARFLYWFGPKRGALAGMVSRRRDRSHKYVRCSCGTWCRVPRGVGKIELMCPKCGEKKIVKT